MRRIGTAILVSSAILAACGSSDARSGSSTLPSGGVPVNNRWTPADYQRRLSDCIKWGNLSIEYPGNCPCDTEAAQRWFQDFAAWERARDSDPGGVEWQGYAKAGLDCAGIPHQ